MQTIVSKTGVMSPMSVIISGLNKDTHREMITLAEGWQDGMVQAAMGADYTSFLNQSGPKLVALFHLLLGLWEGSEYKSVLGHDRTHIAHDMFETLLWAINCDIDQATILLTIFGGVSHDFGRLPEGLLAERAAGMDFTKELEVQLHAALSAKIILDIWQMFFPKITLPETTNMTGGQAFLLRLMNAVVWHGGKNYTLDPVCHHVQSCDRLAGIFGPVQFVRSLLCDVYARGGIIYPNRRHNYSRAWPGFNNLPAVDFRNSKTAIESPTNEIMYIGTPARAVYPLSSEFATLRALEMRIKSGIIISTLCGGPEQKLFKQIFAPELDPNYNPENYEFPQNKRLPDTIWQKILAGPTAQDQAEMAARADWDMDQLINEMFAQQAPDCSPQEMADIKRLLTVEAKMADRPNIRAALLYVNSRRALDAREQREFLLNAPVANDPILGLIRSRLLENPLFNI